MKTRNTIVKKEEVERYINEVYKQMVYLHNEKIMITSEEERIKRLFNYFYDKGEMIVCFYLIQKYNISDRKINNNKDLKRMVLLNKLKKVC